MVHHTMSTSTASAPKASNRITHMALFPRRAAFATILGSVLLVAGCALNSPMPEPAESDRTPPVPSASAPPAPLPSGTVNRPGARWVPAAWSDLPGWEADRQLELMPSLLRSCERPQLEWLRLCADARKARLATDADARAFLQSHLLPYRVEAANGAADGLVTGYFEPLVEAYRQPRAGYRVPLPATPTDLGTKKPYWTRQQLDTLPAAQRNLRELAWLADPLDLLVLQIQGSGRMLVTEADGSRRLVRVAFAAHNDQPYKSVGRWLIDQGELRADQVSWPAIKAWAQRNPKRVNELLWANPRVIFFKEEPLPDPAVGPRGAQGVPLTPGRSVAVDAQSIPYGTPLWLDTTEPLSATPLRRAVMAQDTGTAIVGAVRADYFWGWGSEAEQQAGRMKQTLRLWVLWPKA